MARWYTVQPADRKTMKAALKHVKTKANAAANTNRHLELTQGENEAQTLAGYCEECLMVIEQQAVGDKIELTSGQVMAARSALRVYGGTLEKKEAELGTLLLEGNDVHIEELSEESNKVARLLRVLSPQADTFEPAPSDARPDSDVATPSDTPPDTDSAPAPSEPLKTVAVKQKVKPTKLSKAAKDAARELASAAKSAKKTLGKARAATTDVMASAVAAEAMQSMSTLSEAIDSVLQEETP